MKGHVSSLLSMIWQTGGESDCACILQTCRGLEVYRTLLSKGARIVFEVAVDYSQTAHVWKEMLRLWVCLRNKHVLISLKQPTFV